MDGLAALKLRTASNQKHESGSKFVGNSAKEQLEEFLLALFKKHGVCNYAFLKERFAALAGVKGKIFFLNFLEILKDSANMLAAISEEYFLQTLQEICGSMHEAYYLKKRESAELNVVSTS